MPVDEIDLMQAQLHGIKTALARAPASEKRDNIGVALADQFNKVVEQIGKAFPELKDALPERIKATTDLRLLKRADVTYLDLEALCEQVLNLLGLVH